MSEKSPKQRFTDRVDAYVKYRPSYPGALVDALLRDAELGESARIADLGAGTGIFTRLLLERGKSVVAVEPNDAMREAAKADLSTYSGFSCQPGSAESTALPDQSVDLAVAAQAFHWFDRPLAKREIARILKPGGRLALVWNERLSDTSPFLRDYEALLLEQATDYASVNHANIDDSEIDAFFAPFPVKKSDFPNAQTFDFEGLAGRCRSSSYVPAEGHPGHAAFFAALRALFDRHQNGGQVRFDYRSTLYLGRFR